MLIHVSSIIKEAIMFIYITHSHY